MGLVYDHRELSGVTIARPGVAGVLQLKFAESPQMKLDKDPFPTIMKTVELDGKKVLVRPSQAESTKGKDAFIGEERQPMMIRPTNPEISQWKKNERSNPRPHPKATFNILMAKYRDGKTGIRGHKN
jgi:hypothetical protein